MKFAGYRDSTVYRMRCRFPSPGYQVAGYLSTEGVSAAGDARPLQEQRPQIFKQFIPDVVRFTSGCKSFIMSQGTHLLRASLLQAMHDHCKSTGHPGSHALCPSCDRLIDRETLLVTVRSVW